MTRRNAIAHCSAVCRVRERKAKTGESYQTAWRTVTGATDVNRPSARLSRRVPLPMGSGVFCKPGESLEIFARPQLDSFCPDRLLVKHPESWRLETFMIGLSIGYQVPLEPIERAVFGHETWQSLILHQVHLGQAVTIVASYIGPREQGEPFEAALFGWEGRRPIASPEPPTIADEERVVERAEITHGGTTFKLQFKITAPTLFVTRVTIANAADWVVHDVRVKNHSIFVQAGDVPGEMFSGNAPVILDPLEAGDQIDVLATHVGRRGPTTCLAVEVTGTAEAPEGPRVPSYFLPISTGVSILPEQAAQITARPQRSFAPERVVISQPYAWIVNSIVVGLRHQFAATGDLPGQCFDSAAVGTHVRLDTVQPGQDFQVVVMRHPDCEGGAAFCGGVQGSVVDWIPRGAG